jgi:hypothetical protein
MYHSAIAEIVKEMIGRGILKKGDKYYFEGSVEGVVDYEMSVMEKGNNNVFVMRSRKEVNPFKLYDKDHMVLLFDTLRDSGIEAACNDHPQLKRFYDEGYKSCELLLEKAVQARVTASSDEEREKNKAIMDEAERKLIEAYGALITRVLNGFAKSLQDNPRRAVQVCGAADIFTKGIQNALRAAKQSYIVLLPVKPYYKPS